VHHAHAAAAACAAGEAGDARTHRGVVMTMASLPAGAAGNASVAAGYLLAPLLLRRGPMGAPRQHAAYAMRQGMQRELSETKRKPMRAAGKQLGAPQQVDDALAPPALAALPPRVQRALGFAAATPAPAVTAAAGSGAPPPLSLSRARSTAPHRIAPSHASAFASHCFCLAPAGRGGLKGVAQTKPFAFLRG
jgi:hypothetical protein